MPQLAADLQAGRFGNGHRLDRLAAGCRAGLARERLEPPLSERVPEPVCLAEAGAAGLVFVGLEELHIVHTGRDQRAVAHHGFPGVEQLALARVREADEPGPPTLSPARFELDAIAAIGDQGSGLQHLLAPEPKRGFELERQADAFVRDAFERRGVRRAGLVALVGGAFLQPERLVGVRQQAGLADPHRPVAQPREAIADGLVGDAGGLPVVEQGGDVLAFSERASFRP